LEIGFQEVCTRQFSFLKDGALEIRTPEIGFPKVCL